MISNVNKFCLNIETFNEVFEIFFVEDFWNDFRRQNKKEMLFVDKHAIFIAFLWPFQ